MLPWGPKDSAGLIGAHRESCRIAIGATLAERYAFRRYSLGLFAAAADQSAAPGRLNDHLSSDHRSRVVAKWGAMLQLHELLDFALWSS